MLSSEELLQRFDPISIEEMDQVKLQNRMDTKYAIAEKDLANILSELLPEYRLLVVNGVRGSSYRSLYFDTVDLKHFKDHHNGRSFRSKVRFREYVGSPLVFLEVKRKTGRGGTDKVRKKVGAIPEVLEPEQQTFISKSSGCYEPLVATMWNHFVRLTFVHRTRHERLTIDRGLKFSDASGERDLQGLCIAELKEERADRTSPFAKVMRDRGIRPSGLSKYCAGLILLGRAPKYNTFKEAMLRVNRLRSAA